MKLTGTRILVTGVTGTLGARVAKRLVPEALEVRGLIRNPDQLAAVAHETGARIVHISTTSVYGEPADGQLTESSPLAVDHPAPYIETKIRSERILNEYAAHGLDVRILRSGAICAEHDSYWGDRQVKRMQEAEIVTWVHPDDVVNWVHADNLAEMVYLVLTRGQAGDVFHAVDANIPETDFRMRLIEASGKPYRIPNRIAEHPTYLNDKIVALGYRPVRSFEETMEVLLASFAVPSTPE